MVRLSNVLALAMSGLSQANVITREEMATEDADAFRLWKPRIGDSWQIVLSKPLALDPKAPSITPNKAIFDIDLFDNTKNGTDRSKIDALHRLGKRVICYFSAGTFEPWRPDADKFPEQDKGNPLKDWPSERWVNTKSKAIRDIMVSRIYIAGKMGCDAIDPDNMDGYVSPI
jgi:hypothetical protein